jgi:hypothetical protein
MISSTTPPTASPITARNVTARAHRFVNAHACFGLPVTRNPDSGTVASSTSM